MDKSTQMALQNLDDLDLFDTNEDGESEIQLETRDIERLLNGDDMMVAQCDGSTSTSTKSLCSTDVQVQRENKSDAQSECLTAIPSTSKNFEQHEVETMQFYAEVEVETTRGTSNDELDLNSYQNERRMDNGPHNAPLQSTTIPPVRARSEEPSTSQQSRRALQFQKIRRNSTQSNGNQHDIGGVPFEKFGKGVQSNVDEGNALVESEMEDDSSSNNAPDPWYCIVQLSKKGYSISFEIFKLKRQFLENENLKGRKYQCKVILEETIGICEALSENVAKAGAAIDFLAKFTIQISQCELMVLSPLPTILDGVSKITNISKALGILKEKIRKKYNKELTHRFQTMTEKMGDKYGHGHTVWLWINEVKYEGRSISSYMRAKTASILKAYERIFQEQFPFDPIYMAEVECTSGDYMFKLESAKPYCYDFPQVCDVEAATTMNSMEHGSGKSHTLSDYFLICQPTNNN
ncbi:unnamed protein product [Orchesella dallaii]|uniref:Uncharacterized protein n=1 Tax=Orchesella dallaii TaxID=48710 RepID=A0ABP1Q8M3_9HEXA